MISESEVSQFFFALVLLLFFAHGFGYLFKRLRLPVVVGEIAGGLLLGPSCLGYFLPSIYETTFAEQEKLLSLVYWMGLVLLMFVSGFAVQKTIGKSERRTITALVVGATFIPLLVGWLATSYHDFSPYVGTAGNPVALKIIIAVAIAVTSIPVISRIFLDLGILESRFAKIVLATATIQDVILWVGLAAATGLVGSATVSGFEVLEHVGMTVVFFAVALIVMPRLMRVIGDTRARQFWEYSVAGCVFFLCFLFSALASMLDVNIVFGAFLAGIVLGTIKGRTLDSVRMQIENLSLAFFVPVYFAIVGLKLDLLHAFDVWFFLGFLAFSAIVESAGALLAAFVLRKDWLTSINLAVAMNTRGGPGIVLATVAYEAGIINEIFFSTLVMVAIVTSLLAGYWFRWVLAKNWHLYR